MIPNKLASRTAKITVETKQGIQEFYVHADESISVGAIDGFMVVESLKRKALIPLDRLVAVETELRPSEDGLSEEERESIEACLTFSETVGLKRLTPKAE